MLSTCVIIIRTVVWIMFQAEQVPLDQGLQVCYNSLDEMKKAEAKLPAPWIGVGDSDTSLTLGRVENKTLTVHVEVLSDLSTKVSVLEISAPHLNKGIECIHLKTCLSDLSSCKLCLGVAGLQLQDYAALPTTPGTADKYFLHVLFCDPAGQYCTTTVRSCQCILLSQDSVCQAYAETRRLLPQKQKKEEGKAKQPQNLHDPLLTASKARLKQALEEV